MAVKDILAEVEVNEELASSELESGSTGGGYVKKCGVYPMTIEKAFFTETKKGGLCLDLHFGGENIFTAKLYPVSVRDGKKVTSYEYKGKAVSLGDYKLLKQLLFVTNRNTRKYKNIKADGRATMLIDNRTNQLSDFQNAVAVTAIGIAEEVLKNNRDVISSAFLRKHPHLVDFINGSDNALISLKVGDYVIANFGEVNTLHIKD